jgi:hypothetical protein
MPLTTQTPLHFRSLAMKSYKKNAVCFVVPAVCPSVRLGVSKNQSEMLLCLVHFWVCLVFFFFKYRNCLAMYVCLCICMCVCIYVYTHTHTHTHFTVYLFSQKSVLSLVDFNAACLLNELFHGAC